VYALGAVLYEMLAGRRPYLAHTTDAMAAAQQQPPAPIDDAPPALVALAELALDPDPLARPRASVFEARLRGWLDGAAEDETVLVPVAPATAVVRASPSAHRSLALPRVSGLAGIVAALMIVAVVAGALAFAVATSRPDAADVPAASPPALVSPVPTFSWPPSAAPAADNGGGGGSGGGGGGGGGGHGDGKKGGKGDHGGGHGKGNGH
jgi:hypothetical protein